MTTPKSVLMTGASGVGKSTLIRGALEYYGSGAVVLAPGDDEMDSYIGLLDNPLYKFSTFDDPMFQPSLKEWTADGHTELIRWLKGILTEVKADVIEGKPPRYAVLGVDTISAVGRLAYNSALAKFKYVEPPPAQSPTGSAFYGNIRITLEASIRLMRAIRGLGVHLVVASHPTEGDVTAAFKTGESSSTRVMPDLPGGLKNHLPSYFTTVLDINIAPGGKRIARYGGDPKRVTKSRLGDLGGINGVLNLPASSKGSWEVIALAMDKAIVRLGEIK